MSILDRVFHLLPKWVQSLLLLEDLKRVEAHLEGYRTIVRVLEDRRSEIRTRLYELGVKP